MTDAQFRWWSFWAWFRHLWNEHTWVPIEDWGDLSETGLVEVVGYSCWRCPARRPL